jgi:hypothetical protein
MRQLSRICPYTLGNVHLDHVQALKNVGRRFEIMVSFR